MSKTENTGETVIGIDVAKEDLVVFIDSSNEYLSCRNTVNELKALARRVKRLSPLLIALEASGGYEKKAASVFHSADLPVAVVFPRRVRQFAHGLGLIAKNDEIDAKLIARYARVAEVKPQPKPRPELIRLRALNQRRSQLIEMRLCERSRLDTADRSVHSDIKKHIKWIDRQIAKLEDTIHDSISADSRLDEVDHRLRSVPGVGPVLSSTLITELPELGQLSSKRIASLVGVAPFAHESGKQMGRRFCKGGRNQVRRVLYMASVSATRFNPVIRDFYSQLCSRGKLKKVALIACSRKLLVILNAIAKNNTTWIRHNQPLST